jgi:hypothetical protein
MVLGRNLSVDNDQPLLAMAPAEESTPDVMRATFDLAEGSHCQLEIQSVDAASRVADRWIAVDKAMAE